MSKRTDSEQHWHAQSLAYLQKSPQILVSRPIKYPFLFFYMNPEDVGSDDGNTASLDFPQFIRPILTWKTRKVKFPHDGNGWLAIARHIVVGKSKRFSTWTA